jgi:hypothetical protein
MRVRAHVARHQVVFRKENLDMSPPFLGNCLCGQVKFQLNSEPLTLYACHCTDCQIRSGGALLLSMWVQRNSLEVLEGNPQLVSSLANDGRERRNKVCPACAVRLWSEPVNRPSHAVLRPGTLQRAQGLRAHRPSVCSQCAAVVCLSRRRCTLRNNAR